MADSLVTNFTDSSEVIGGERIVNQSKIWTGFVIITHCIKETEHKGCVAVTRKSSATQRRNQNYASEQKTLIYVN